MNECIRNNLRESAIIAIISTTVATTVATGSLRPPGEMPVDSLPPVTFIDLVDAVTEQPIVESATRPVADVELDERDVFCLQQNIYYEARGEPTKEQRAVAWVTLNRVENETWPDSVCDVVWQPSQFSWTRHTVEDVPEFKNNIEQKAWDTAGDIAESVMTRYQRKYPDPTGGADHYHARSVRPAWANPNKITLASTHVFYKLR